MIAYFVCYIHANMTIYTKPGMMFGIFNGKESVLSSGEQLILEYTDTAGEVIQAWQQILTVLDDERVEYSEVPVKVDSAGKPYSDYAHRKSIRTFSGAEINEMKFVTSADFIFRMWHLYWRETIETHSERT